MRLPKLSPQDWLLIAAVHDEVQLVSQVQVKSTFADDECCPRMWLVESLNDGEWETMRVSATQVFEARLTAFPGVTGACDCRCGATRSAAT